MAEGTNWTSLSKAEKAALVAPLWRDGLSATEIAIEIGVTRNAICSILYRAGIGPDQRPAPRPIKGLMKALSTAGRHPVKRAIAKPDPVAVEAPQAPVRAPRVPGPEPEETPPTPPPSPEPEPFEWPEPEPDFAATGPAPLIGLALHRCRFPLFDDPRQAPFGELMACGEMIKPGSPYCPDHHARCYHPARGPQVKPFGLYRVGHAR